MTSPRERLLAIMLDSGVTQEAVRNLKPGIPLIKQGVDSIDHAAILLNIQDTLGVVVSDEEAQALSTLEDFEALLKRT